MQHRLCSLTGRKWTAHSPSAKCGPPSTVRWSRLEFLCRRTRQPQLRANRNRQPSNFQEDLLNTNWPFRLSLTVLLAVSFFIVSVGCGTKLEGNDVAATVDGRKIYRADVEKYYENQTGGSQQSPTGEQATSLRLSILRELVDNEILMRRAEEMGVFATDE